MTSHPHSPAGRSKSPLPVQATVAEAYRLIWRERDELLRLGLVPALASFVLNVVTSQRDPEPAALLWGFLHLFPLTVFLVRWNRLVLLGRAQTAPGLGIGWERRDTRYLAFWLLVSGAISLLMGIPAILIVELTQQSGLGYLLCVALMLACVYVTLRLSLILTAIAVDAPYSLAKSWSDTADWGFQLLAGTLLANVPIVFAVLVIHAVLAPLGIPQAAPLSFVLLDTVVAYLVLATYTTILALAFRRATGWPQLRDPAGAA